MIVFLRSAWGLFVIVLAVVFVTGAGVIVATFTGGTHPVIHHFYQAFGRMALWGFRASLHVRGTEHLKSGKRYVVVPNHSSQLDIPAVIRALHEHPLRFIAKQELSRIPIFGAALRASGTIFVTRSDTKTDVRRMEEAQEQLLQHVSVLFFAEGTRSDTGELGEFKRGAAVFATRSGLPIVPVGIAGSHEILPRGMKALRGGPIAVSIGEPIPTTGVTVADRDALTGKVREAVAAEIERARELLEEQ